MDHLHNTKLLRAFTENNINLTIKSDHIVVEDSCEREKIIEIVKLVGFCPLISEHKIDGRFVFTLIPYKIPDFFRQGQKLPSNEKGENYLNIEEISSLLQFDRFVIRRSDQVEDRWSSLNKNRSIVSLASKDALSTIITKCAKSDLPIVEIGSGIGYTFSNELLKQMIRTQCDYRDAHVLRESFEGPIYQLDIKGIYDRLVNSGKKVPLFFALNVFDTISPQERKTSFLQISTLQNRGDHILILLNTNPCLDIAIEHLESLHPGHVVIPFFPESTIPTKFSVILVPIQYGFRKLSRNELIEMMNRYPGEIMKGFVPTMQQRLHELQRIHKFAVIVLEDFFADHIKNQLNEVGYDVEIRYQTSVLSGESPKGFSIEQDLVYSSVTDMLVPIGQWSVTDRRLLQSLTNKNLHLPNHFDEDYLQSLRRRRLKLFGAEFLVIEARKK